MKIKRTAYDPLGISNSKIIFNKKTIEGPIRGAPHTDYKHFKNGFKDLKIRAPSLQFGEVIKDLYPLNLNELVTKPDATINLSNWFKNKAKIISNDPVIIIPRILRDTRIGIPHMQQLVEAQVNAQLDVLTIPDAKERAFDPVWKNAMEIGIKDAVQLQPSNNHDVVMPIISFNQPYKTVLAKIKFLLNLDVDINALGFRSGTNFGPKLKRAVELIRNHKEVEVREMWLHFTDIGLKLNSLSQPHISILGNIDTVSTRKISDKQVRYLAATNAREPEQSDFSVPQEPSQPISNTNSSAVGGRIKPKNDLLKPSELLYQSEQRHLMNVQQGNFCSCPTHTRFSNYGSLSQILNSTDRKKFVTVHDLVCSSQQFSLIHKEIINQDLIDYYRQKPSVVGQSELIDKKFGVKI